MQPRVTSYEERGQRHTSASVIDISVRGLDPEGKHHLNAVGGKRHKGCGEGDGALRLEMMAKKILH